ncbi:allophanate hydrolase subunit 1 [Siculibacillus lacustris]|uniref:Allophanate hydrolase subunit 1 n=1 Tax=Siculibacillus lacustris TaxID=1549641 RepID=A0A4Q9VVH6_9HYPH|nr:allophanate hydrolase subunit 1 [Siculibacillus lacustris]TBW40269.1 allophanate hydrolase subunit 1 [Siculibacillus lacustris]
MVPLRFLDGGEAMLVVEFGDTIDAGLNERVQALDVALQAAAVPGVIESVPTFRSLAVHYEPLEIPRDTLVARILDLETRAEVTPRPLRTWVLPACYEAPHAEDLAEAADRLALTPARLVALHVAARFRVHMYGFAPGFAYLGGLPDELGLPRRDRPRAPHPANAIMIAGGMAAVASVPMPTGWWVIGRSAERMFALGREPAFLVAAGDTLRFEAVDAATFAALEARVAAGEVVARSEATP